MQIKKSIWTENINNTADDCFLPEGLVIDWSILSILHVVSVWLALLEGYLLTKYLLIDEGIIEIASASL